MANDGWERGWHERNGGNLSYRVKPEEVDPLRKTLKQRVEANRYEAFRNLAGEYFLVNRSASISAMLSLSQKHLHLHDRGR